MSENSATKEAIKSVNKAIIAAEKAIDLIDENSILLWGDELPDGQEISVDSLVSETSKGTYSLPTFTVRPKKSDGNLTGEVYCRVEGLKSLGLKVGNVIKIRSISGAKSEDLASVDWYNPQGFPLLMVIALPGSHLSEHHWRNDPGCRVVGGYKIEKGVQKHLSEKPESIIGLSKVNNVWLSNINVASFQPEIFIVRKETEKEDLLSVKTAMKKLRNDQYIEKGLIAPDIDDELREQDGSEPVRTK